MFLTFERFISHRYLFLSKKEGFVSVIAWFAFIGIALGVATLIVVMSVMNGFRHELFGALVNMKGHASIYQQGHLMEANETLLKDIQSVPGVKQAHPMLEQQAILMIGQQAIGVMIQGLPEESILSRSIIKLNKEAPYTEANLMSKEEFVSSFVENHVFLGRRLAETLNLKVGDSISLLSSKSTATAFGSVPRQKTFRVGGVFHVGMRDFDKSFIMMPLKTAQAFFKAENKWTQIDVFSVYNDISTHLTHTLQLMLETKEFSKHLSVHDWHHSDASIFHAVKMERNVMFLILTLIILIASFNIITGLTMMVKDKTKDISILRTMGASKSQILRIFILAGSFIGIVGTFLGVSLGLSFALNIETIRQFLQSLSGAELFSEEIYFLSTLPVYVDLQDVMNTGALSLSLSFIATLYPSWRASAMDPIQGIKGIG